MLLFHLDAKPSGTPKAGKMFIIRRLFGPPAFPSLCGEFLNGAILFVPVDFVVLSLVLGILFELL